MLTKSHYTPDSHYAIALNKRFIPREKYTTTLLNEGDVIALVDDTITTVGDDETDVVERTLQGLQGQPEIVTIYRGEATSESDANSLRDKLTGSFPGVEFEMQREAFGFHFGADHAHGVLDEGVHITGSHVELELAAGNACDIEEVVDQLGFDLHAGADFFEVLADVFGDV